VLREPLLREDGDLLRHVLLSWRPGLLQRHMLRVRRVLLRHVLLPSWASML
jgi:hypothetical protein